MNEHRKAVVLFAVALAFAIVIASVTTLDRVATHKVSSDTLQCVVTDANYNREG